MLPALLASRSVHFRGTNSHGFTTQDMECVEPLSKEDCIQVRNLPSARIVAPGQSVSTNAFRIPSRLAGSRRSSCSRGRLGSPAGAGHRTRNALRSNAFFEPADSFPVLSCIKTEGACGKVDDCSAGLPVMIVRAYGAFENIIF
jgi:hypothetical protein